MSSPEGIRFAVGTARLQKTACLYDCLQYPVGLLAHFTFYLGTLLRCSHASRGGVLGGAAGSRIRQVSLLPLRDNKVSHSGSSVSNLLNAVELSEGDGEICFSDDT